MLVYEKKVEGERHLYGKVEGTVPAANDTQLTYKDAEGNTLTIQEKDTYKDDGKGGIYRVSDKKAVNVFIGNTQIIGEEIEVESTPEVTMTAIEVTTPPTKTVYTAGEELDLTGMVVTLIGTDGTQEVTDLVAYNEYTTSPEAGTVLTTDITEVVVSAYDFEDSFTITVNAAEETTLTAIEVTAPTKTSYVEGDTLDLTGMIVKEVYSDGTKEEITTGFTVSPENGATLTEDVSEVTVTHTASEFTDTFRITVTPANNEEPGQSGE